MLKTGMYNKLEEMKNGGYTLFSDKTRKMLLAMGLSLLSIGTLSQVANAEIFADVQFKKNGGENLTAGKYRYQIELTEDTENIAGIYLGSDDTTSVDYFYGSVAGKQQATVVIEVPDTETSVVVKNDSLDPEEDVDVKTISLTVPAEKVDNAGPVPDQKTFIKYVTEEGKYIQVRLTDNTKVYRIEDEDGHDRVLLKEKEQDKDVTVKYVLQDDESKDDDIKFIVYDLLGNPTEVKLADAVIDSLFNARNLEGTRIAIDVTRSFTEIVDNTDPEHPVTKTYNLTGVTTGAGQEIPLQGADQDIYEGLPQGTTRLILTYTNPEDPTDTKTVILPLILDKTGPEPVAYSTVVTDEGVDPLNRPITAYNIKVDKTGTARAYLNKDKGKGIVEVKDIQSGISKIVTLTGTAGNYEEETVVYNVTDLQTTVLWLFNVTQDTTAVRVYDGVGCYVDLPLVTDNNAEGTTVATIRREEDGTYTLIAQDTQAGLGYIERDGEEENLANFRNSLGFVLPATTPRGDEQMYHDNTVFRQYTLEKFQMTIDDEGKPIIHIYDALGNESLVDFDQFAFICHYATFNDEDSLSISVTESRGIWKIVTTIVDKDIAPENQVTMPNFPEPSPAPAMPSEAKPEGAAVLAEPTSVVPEGDDLITPPDEGTVARERWNDWVAAGLADPTDPRAPQAGQSGYELFLKYLEYREQQAIIKEHADYEAQQQLLADWDEYEKWLAWDAYNTYRETYANTYTLEVFAQDHEPEDFTRTYEVPEGIVEEVRIYNTRGDETLYNTISTVAQPAKPNCGQLINIENVTDADRVTTTQAKLATEGTGAEEKVVGATLTAKYGIKRVTYSDGCVVQFYDELPTELFVNCKVVDEQSGEEAILTAVVMDAIGDTATITESGVVCNWNDTDALGTVTPHNYNTVSLS